ncbi:hypothetical protein HYP55_gp061 [Salmonella phage Mutine]|uniref:Uncharacterized protein n=1 Tax=Salmonella phage Mutine TaxID=2054274 RepID=A0A2H5BPS0_9CAUD|nr:hypothetical protein HYP55_gp061 [Salmonella phage Mutine]AUG88324.1 hypothetical protein CPT_Mutine_192 [Salmonella phage Mutine]
MFVPAYHPSFRTGLSSTISPSFTSISFHPASGVVLLPCPITRFAFHAFTIQI